jgi:hypothetical protein
MKRLLISSAALLVCTMAQAQAPGDRSAEIPAASIQLAANQSSNSSSNTSSNSSAGGSSYVHTHTWSVDSNDGRRRRSVGGTTRIERYTPGFERRYYRRDRRD